MNLPKFTADLSLYKSTMNNSMSIIGTPEVGGVVVPMGWWCAYCSPEHSLWWKAQYRASNWAKAFSKAVSRCGQPFQLTSGRCQPSGWVPIYRCEGWGLGKGGCQQIYPIYG